MESKNRKTGWQNNGLITFCLQTQHPYQYQSDKNYSHKGSSVIMSYTPVILHPCDNNLQHQIIL